MLLAKTLAAATLLSLTLTACQTTASVATDPTCKAFRPIAWSALDTRGTQEQATEHNAVGAAVCGWKKKAS